MCVFGGGGLSGGGHDKAGGVADEQCALFDSYGEEGGMGAVAFVRVVGRSWRVRARLVVLSLRRMRYTQPISRLKKNSCRRRQSSDVLPHQQRMHGGKSSVQNERRFGPFTPYFLFRRQTQNFRTLFKYVILRRICFTVVVPVL